MKLYVWNRVANATSNYHHSGGIVAIADSLERAREMIDVRTKEDEVEEACHALTKEPDLVRECAGPEFLAIHPDAGCC